MENIRERNQYKVARVDSINNYTQKLKDELDKQAEYEQLLKRKEMMENSQLFKKSRKKGPIAASELSQLSTSRK